jgi:hypothetical protein
LKDKIKKELPQLSLLGFDSNREQKVGKNKTTDMLWAKA